MKATFIALGLALLVFQQGEAIKCFQGAAGAAVDGDCTDTTATLCHQ